MKQQPDNLFREKLENIQLTAPANAWSKIEDVLDKKTSGFFWLKIAAGLLLFSIASVLVWNFSSFESDKAVATSNTLNTNTESNNTTPEYPETSVPKTAINNQSVAIKTESIQKFEPIKVIDTHPVVSQSVIKDEEIKNEAPALESFIAEVEIKIDEPQQTGVYIVYTANEVNQKYLRQQPVDDATSPEKKSSRIQMLMGVANNLKISENGLGDLRQMKDEIFALNFLDEKKQQNKKN